MQGEDQETSLGAGTRPSLNQELENFDFLTEVSTKCDLYSLHRETIIDTTSSIFYTLEIFKRFYSWNMFNPEIIIWVDSRNSK